MDYDNPPSKAPLERITMSSIGRLMLQAFNLEKGLFYTLWGLTFWPEKVINVYLFEDRNKATKPFTFMLMLTALMAYVTLSFVDFDMMLSEQISSGDPEKLKESHKAIREIVVDLYNRWFNLLSFATVPFAALTTYWFFGRAKYYFAEHLILNTYIVAYTGIFLIVTTFLTPMLGYFVVTQIYFLLAFVYTVYAYGRLFPQYSRWQNIVRSSLAVSIYYLSYILFFALFIVAFLLIKKNILN